MALRRLAVFSTSLFLFGAATAAATEPRAGVVLSGAIEFPREQTMTIRTDAHDGSKLTLGMGFDGRCRGGGLGEVFPSNLRTTPEVRARDGRFSATVNGTLRDLGGVQGRTGLFRWRV